MTFAEVRPSVIDPPVIAKRSAGIKHGRFGRYRGMRAFDKLLPGSRTTVPGNEFVHLRADVFVEFRLAGIHQPERYASRPNS